MDRILAPIALAVGLLPDPARCASHVITQFGERYTPLHPQLFDDGHGPREEWFDDAFLGAVAGGEASLRQILRREHPDAHVYSFPFLRPRFAVMLLEEARNYNASGLTTRKPNGMNNFGILWNHIGMEPMFRAIQLKYIAPVARLLFPHVGGRSLDHHHTYLVQYSEDMDPHGLDVHHDSCDITFNAALDEPSSYEGSGLTFCGLYSTEGYRQYSFTYRHQLGRAILYDGRMRHGAEPITAGARTNLVMWSHSATYRQTSAYRRNNVPAHRQKAGSDPRCVSHHHDDDYCQYRLPGYERRCDADGANTFGPAWRKALKGEDYWEIGSVLEEVKPRKEPECQRREQTWDEFRSTRQELF